MDIESCSRVRAGWLENVGVLCIYSFGWVVLDLWSIGCVFWGRFWGGEVLMLWICWIRWIALVMRRIRMWMPCRVVNWIFEFEILGTGMHGEMVWNYCLREQGPVGELRKAQMRRGRGGGVEGLDVQVLGWAMAG